MSESVVVLESSQPTHVCAAAARRVIVTGASRGIGRAIAIECARRGAIVGANYFRSTEEAESLRAMYPGQIELLPFDVRDCAATEAAIDAFADKYGAPDVLVNNAGVGGRPTFLIRLSTDRLTDIATTNFLGALYSTRSALKLMSKARRGRIISISSVSAHTPLDGMTVYAASKAAVEALAMTVAKEYGNRGITAHAVRFGLVRTDMTKSWIDMIPTDDASPVLEPEEVGRFVGEMIFGEPSWASGTAIDYPVRAPKDAA